MDLIEDMGAAERGGLLVTRGTQTDCTGESNGERGGLLVTIGTQTDCTGESNGKPTGTVGSPTDEGGSRLTVTLGTETKQRILRLAEQLLPGLSDEITLDHICTKLPWTVFHILTGVSRLWEQAIQSRRVYDARVRANSTETLVVLQHGHYESYGISLYCMRENHWYRVPGISQLQTGFPKTFKCVALDGKIYVLGGDCRGQDDSELYVLDLMGQKQWEQCEGIDTPRMDFGLEVLDGKIYLCGSMCDGIDPLLGCAMYDPKEDVWSWISSMTKIRFGHHVTAFGGELFAYGGSVGLLHAEKNKRYCYVEESLFLDVYNADQDKWRVVEPFGQEGLQRLFVARGKLYLMTVDSIYALDDGDVEKNAWTELHSFSLPYSPFHDYEAFPTLVVDDKLLTMRECAVNPGDLYNADKTCLFQTKGFGGMTEELVWEEVNCPLSFEIRSSMCLIQL